MVASTASDAPLVVVVGATGKQGGSVVKALSKSDKPYRLRGLTRDASKPAALKLKEQGVEPYSVNIAVGNEADVAKAFEGAAYVSAVTDYWSHLSLDREVAEGKLIVDAVKKSGATLIWSGLDSYKLNSKGKYTHVQHFEGKYQVTQYAKEQGVQTIVVQPAYYAQNLTGPSFGPRKNEDGSYVMATVYNEDTLLPIIDIESDYGLYVQAAIEHHKPGDELLAHSEVIKFGDLVKQLAEVTGKKISFYQITDDQLIEGLKSSGSPPVIVSDVSEMMFAQREFGYYGGRDVQPSRKHLAGPTQSFKEFAKRADWSAVLN